MAIETTLVLVKPDGVRRGLAGEVVSRFERRGYDLRGARLLKIPRSLAAEHYAEHKGKPFYDGLVEFITGGPLVAAVVQGPRAVSAFRQLAGGTDPVEKAANGSIRGDFGLETKTNLVHGSDSTESAVREIRLWFPDL